jgi:hypothetical protein
MNREALIKKIKEKAKTDAKNRRDRRYLETMGFLVAKGFLRTNLQAHLGSNKRLRIADAIWAGENVEPRILEVLPAAVLRLGKHFDLDPVKHEKLALVIAQLRKRQPDGDDFFGMPYEKVKVWADLPLRDRRVKAVGEKKIMKTFRLDRLAVERLANRARKEKSTETEVLEKLLLSDSNIGHAS